MFACFEFLTPEKARVFKKKYIFLFCKQMLKTGVAIGIAWAVTTAFTDTVKIEVEVEDEGKITTAEPEMLQMKRTYTTTHKDASPWMLSAYQRNVVTSDLRTMFGRDCVHDDWHNVPWNKLPDGRSQLTCQTTLRKSRVDWVDHHDAVYGYIWDAIDIDMSKMWHENHATFPVDSVESRKHGQWWRYFFPVTHVTSVTRWPSPSPWTVVNASTNEVMETISSKPQ